MTTPHTTGEDQDPMTEITDTPCQRNCCWTPHGICTTRHTCRHHTADQHRSSVALRHRSSSRHLFSNPEVHISPAAEQGRTDLRPTFSHQERIEHQSSTSGFL
ncbi:hypothetical protein I2485_01955 [Nesterenkonia sp. E16_7]|uniref:hypothetical protein n=1 Tax=unclassified Nesterenkonia TaxID=2629769 RepID=UPI001A92186F|nr:MULTISPECIES: hypothetical protein [unclassified Nesterenkonia]MBO0596360.1 hypothetical protein [Nesterenkonia sp. E16_10]MBO0597412.1 hypothetical protein [Nesterenkonia sp. E16_7]